MAIRKESAGHVQATLDLGDIEIGAVELKDETTDVRAKVAATGSIAEGDNAVAMQAPVLGATADAAVVTDAAGTLSGKLRGLVKWAFERMPVSLGQKSMAASFPVTIASDQSSFPIVVEDIEDGTGDSIMDAANDAIQTSIVADSVGLATSANQATIIGHVDGLEGLLTTIDADTGAIKTAIELIDHLITAGAGNVDAGTQRVTIATDDVNLAAIKTAIELIDHLTTAGAGNVDASTQRVTVATDDVNLAAIKTAIELIDHQTAANAGNVDANTQRIVVATDDVNLAAIKTAVETIDNMISGNEAQVDVLSVIPGTAATNLGKAEDAGHTSGDTGVMLLGVRKDTAPSAIAGADGDYIPAIFDENGNLWVSLGTKLDKDNDEVLIWANTAKDGTGTDYVPLVDSDGHLQVDALNTPIVTPATSGGGGENINTTTALTTDFYLRAITIHFDAAWTNDVTVTLDATDGAAYDTVLRTLAGGAGITDMVWIVEGDFLFENGDQIVVTGTNPGTVVFGLRIVTEEA